MAPRWPPTSSPRTACRINQTETMAGAVQRSSFWNYAGIQWWNVLFDMIKGSYTALVHTACCRLNSRMLPFASSSMQGDWLVRPDEQKGVAETLPMACSVPRRDKLACGGHLSLLSTGGQPFSSERPMIRVFP